MDYSTASADGAGPARRAGPDDAVPPRLDARRDRGGAARYGDDIQPGDIFCLNDPFEGRHAPARHFCLPADLRRRARSRLRRTVCHHTDVGGRVAGLERLGLDRDLTRRGCASRRSSSTTAAVPNETLVRLVEKNVRLPVRVIGDLRAPARRLPHRRARVPRRWSPSTGPTKSSATWRSLIDYAERLTRAALPELPDGGLRLRGLDR